MSEVGSLIISLQAETAKFREDMGKVKRDLADLKDGTDRYGDATELNMAKATGSMMLVEDSLGVRLPRHLNRLIAEMPVVGMAFQMMLPIAGVVAAISIVTELIHKHEELKGSALRLEQAQLSAGNTGAAAFLKLHDKLLEVGIKTDELAGNHTAALKKQLELIDNQSFGELIEQFKLFEKAADSVFDNIKSHWYTMGSGSEGARKSLTEFSIEYERLLQAKDTSGAAKLLEDKVKREETILKLQKQGVELSKHDTTGYSEAGVKLAAVMVQLKEYSAGNTKDEVVSQQALVNALHQTVQARQEDAQIASGEKGNAKTRAAITSMEAQVALQKIINEGKEEYAAIVARVSEIDAEATHIGDKGQHDPSQALNAAIEASNKEYDAAVSKADAILAKQQANYAADLSVYGITEEKKAELKAKYANDVQARDGAIAVAAAEGFKRTAQAEAEYEAQSLQRHLEIIKKRSEATKQATTTELESVRTIKKAEEETAKAGLESQLGDVKNMESLGLITKRAAIQAEITLEEKAREAKEQSIRATTKLEMDAYKTQLAEAKKSADEQAKLGVKKGDTGYTDYQSQVIALNQKITTTAIASGAAITTANTQAGTSIKALQTTAQSLNASWGNYFGKMKTETEDLSTQIRTTLQNSVTQFTKSFGDSMAKSIVEGKSLGQAVRQEAAHMLEAMISMLVQWVEKWIISHVVMAAFGTSSQAAQVATAKTAASQIAMANMIASWSLAPWPLDSMAPAMGAQMGALALAAADGGLVPGQGNTDSVPTMLMPGETVVSKALTEQVRNNTGGSQGSGEVHNHFSYSPQVSAIDSAGVGDMLKKHANEFNKHIVSTMRKQHKMTH